MSPITSTFVVLILLCSTAYGHSQMRCAKYDIATKSCLAPIRNQAQSFGEEANDMASGGGVCNSPITNPISASYANGKGCPDWAPCPLPMGTYYQGETFTIMWFARNHATADQTPGNITLYISPVEAMNVGRETDVSVFQQNKICEAPFASCNGLNGDQVQCYASCKIPTSAAVGIHTLWWKWVWTGHTSIYTTCADVYVTAGSSSSSTPTPTPTPVPTPVPSTTARPAAATTGRVVPSTTARPVAATTGRVVPSTTAAPAAVTTGRAAPVTTASAPAPAVTTSKVVTPVPVPSATTAKVVTPVPSSSSSSSSSSSKICTFGDRICSSQNQYKICVQNRDASTYWSEAMSCQTGLSCHPSATANSIYCY